MSRHRRDRLHYLRSLLGGQWFAAALYSGSPDRRLALSEIVEFSRNSKEGKKVLTYLQELVVTTESQAEIDQRVKNTLRWVRFLQGKR